MRFILIFNSLFLCFFLSNTLGANNSVAVQINNKSGLMIEYLIDNFRYDDDERVWDNLPTDFSVQESIPFTTKYGYFTLKIKDAELSYTPSGNNKRVTVYISVDCDNKLKLERYPYIR